MKMHVIDSCIQWNIERFKKAKTETDKKRYAQNIKNLKALMETDGEEARPNGEGVGEY